MDRVDLQFEGLKFKLILEEPDSFYKPDHYLLNDFN